MGACAVLWFWTAPDRDETRTRRGADLEMDWWLMRPGGASRRCCKFSRSLRGDGYRELPERGVEGAEPGQPKSLGTDAFTASQVLEEPAALAERSVGGCWSSGVWP